MLKVTSTLMLMLISLMGIQALNAQGPTSKPAYPVDKEMMGEKCDRFKKSYEDMQLEIKEIESQNVASERLEDLKRNLPRVKVQMEYYCEKSM